MIIKKVKYTFYDENKKPLKKLNKLINKCIDLFYKYSEFYEININHISKFEQCFSFHILPNVDVFSITINFQDNKAYLSPYQIFSIYHLDNINPKLRKKIFKLIEEFNDEK